MAERFPFSVTFHDPASASVIPILKAPSDVNGGGITILEAYAEATDTEALSQGVGGTTYTLQLLKYDNAGTPAVNGTVSTNILGGTAVGWAANVPQSFTLDSDYTFLDAGESLRVNYAEVNSGDPTGAVTVYGVAIFGR